MTKLVIKTAKADDPIYKERIMISSSLGGIMIRARENYLMRLKKSQKNLELEDRQLPLNKP